MNAFMSLFFYNETFLENRIWKKITDKLIIIYDRICNNIVTLIFVRHIQHFVFYILSRDSEF